MTRRQAREQALCIIFERMFKDETVDEILSLAKDARDVEPDGFAVRLAQGVCDNVGEIDEKIKRFSIRWKNERLSKVVMSILRMAIFEMDSANGIPVSVTINEAVELAKKYGGDGDSAFVNGLLGAFARRGLPGGANGEECPDKNRASGKKNTGGKTKDCGKTAGDRPGDCPAKAE